MSNHKEVKKQQLNPPNVLIKTWCTLDRDEDEQVRMHAMKMLLGTFGDLESVIEFVKNKNIKV
ncbi:hypothetical protein H4J56_13855 [Colwellia sp. BRX8-4]|uniref:hypothetical protein n=1 Tax=Colwellia sp. BRX8-4 TaxID=2759836 RepID=UPI0015F3D5BF|nr:hypothetical protein [Colwellia sp. BRX8-4]MBA6365131.1 hypothetical protein [Colwellia sp. BRX8-8]MBA6372504.1 hypothetical protein [Colwellia sp. BRX8-4]